MWAQVEGQADARVVDRQPDGVHDGPVRPRRVPGRRAAHRRARLLQGVELPAGGRPAVPGSGRGPADRRPGAPARRGRDRRRRAVGPAGVVAHGVLAVALARRDWPSPRSSCSRSGSSGSRWWAGATGRAVETARRVAVALAATPVAAIAAFALYRGAALFLAPVIGELAPPAGPITRLAAIIPVVTFASLAIFQAALPALGRLAAVRALHVHALNGFYFGALADRLVDRVWATFQTREVPVREREAVIDFLAGPCSDVHMGGRRPRLRAHPAGCGTCRTYVAVNPFLGFADRPIAEAAGELGDRLGAARSCRGSSTTAAAGPRAPSTRTTSPGRPGDDADPALRGRPRRSRRDRRRPDAGRPHLRRAARPRHGTDWEDAVIRQIARWCAVHASGGGTYWRLHDRGPGPLRFLARGGRGRPHAGDRRAARLAAIGRPTPRRARRRRSRPARRGSASPPTAREPYLYRLLGGRLRLGLVPPARLVAARGRRPRRARRPAGDPHLPPTPPSPPSSPPQGRPGGRDERPAPPRPARRGVEDESTRLVLQEALEDGFARRLLGPARAAAVARATATRPAVQAVFCIDVRSEPLRRHLEAQSDRIETLRLRRVLRRVARLAGRRRRRAARCPVLLRAGRRRPARAGRRAGRRAAGRVKHLQAAPAAAFHFVELLGLAYGLGLAADALAARPGGRSSTRGACRSTSTPDGLGAGIPVEARVDLAAGILKNMGLRPLVRPARAALRPRGPQREQPARRRPATAARAAATAGRSTPGSPPRSSTTRTVREGLPVRGFDVPGRHRTSSPASTTRRSTRSRCSTMAALPASHRADLDALREQLDAAGALRARERAAGARPGRPAAGRSSTACSGGGPATGRRCGPSGAWPATPRSSPRVGSRTRGVDLDGRAFLHEYDATTDPDGSILTLILSAPMVVASWINLQYFASTVDNRAFGCGTKALHNRVGTLGVVVGNGGDLRTGLPLQSVHAADGRGSTSPSGSRSWSRRTASGSTPSSPPGPTSRPWSTTAGSASSASIPNPRAWPFAGPTASGTSSTGRERGGVGGRVPGPRENGS